MNNFFDTMDIVNSTISIGNSNKGDCYLLQNILTQPTDLSHFVVYYHNFADNKRYCIRFQKTETKYLICLVECEKVPNNCCKAVVKLTSYSYEDYDFKTISYSLDGNNEIILDSMKVFNHTNMYGNNIY